MLDENIKKDNYDGFSTYDGDEVRDNERFLKQRKKCDETYNKRIKRINEMNRQIDFNNLVCKYKFGKIISLGAIKKLFRIHHQEP